MLDQKQKRSLPVLSWMRYPVDVSQIEECPSKVLPYLDPRLENALQRIGFSSLFPIQVAVWLETVGSGAFHRDLFINSPVGSGKSLAYALPIVQMLSTIDSTSDVRCLRALVVLPIHELALQVAQVFASIASAVGLSVGLAVGVGAKKLKVGSCYDTEDHADGFHNSMKGPKLEAGICCDPEDHKSVDILVATPGRLVDHINNTKGFTLEHLRYLVVDDIGRLLDSLPSWFPTVLQLTQTDEEDIFSRDFGSQETIRKCRMERGFQGKTSPRLVKMFLSASFTCDPSKLSLLNLHNPLLLIARQTQFPEKLESYKLICESKDKALYLVALLQKLKGEKCIVFMSSNQLINKLSTFLKIFGGLPFKFSKYSGLQRRSEQSKTIAAFRQGKVQILVTTDGMTRRMDVKGVSTIINYDMPARTKIYLHRAGKTARAVEAGRCAKP